MIPAPVAAPASVPQISSDRLFGAGPVIQIVHGGALYTLRITRLGKLILTK